MLDQEEKKGEEQELQPQVDQGAEKANETGGGGGGGGDMEAPGQQPDVQNDHGHPTIEMSGMEPGQYPHGVEQEVRFHGENGQNRPPQVNMAFRDAEGNVVWELSAPTNDKLGGGWGSQCIFNSRMLKPGKYSFQYWAVNDAGSSKIETVKVEFVDVKKHESDGGLGPTAGDSDAGSAEN
jgi:hypothetical protein